MIRNELEMQKQIFQTKFVIDYFLKSKFTIMVQKTKIYFSDNIIIELLYDVYCIHKYVKI